jgi:nucleotide-binding universal stress UspA family protein
VFQRILWLNDLDPGAQAARPWLERRALVDPDAQVWVVAVGEGRRAGIEAAAAALRGARVAAEARELPGRPAEAAGVLVAEHAVQLVVVGQGQKKPLDRWLGGGVARRLLRGTAASMLVVAPGAPAAFADVVLVVADDDRTLDTAWAAVNAVAPGAAVRVVGVLVPNGGASTTEEVFDRLAARVRDAAGGALPPGWSVEVVAASEVLEGVLYAAARCELLVLASGEGRAGAVDAADAEGAVEDASCSVLVLR